MPLKGQSFNRTPNIHRTRRDSSLSSSLKHLLIVDIVQADDTAPPSDICDLRPVYGERGSLKRRAVCRRITYLRSLKQKDENQFWELYLRAVEPQQKEESELESACMDKDEDEDYVESSYDSEEEESLDEEDYEEEEEVVVTKKSPGKTKSQVKAKKILASKVKIQTRTPVKSSPIIRKPLPVIHATSSPSRPASKMVDYDLIKYVDSAEVTVNVLCTNLLIFRIVDYADEKDRLHNGYQILYTGDCAAAMSGLLKVEKISKNEVLVTMPCVPNSFLKSLNDVSKAMGEKYNIGHVSKAYTTAASKLLTTKEKQVMKILIKFERTGEVLTNRVFSSENVPNGQIFPEPTPVVTKAEILGETIVTTDMYVAYNVARVESEYRTKRIGEPDGANLIAAAFLRGVTLEPTFEMEDVAFEMEDNVPLVVVSADAAAQLAREQADIDRQRALASAEQERLELGNQQQEAQQMKLEEQERVLVGKLHQLESERSDIKRQWQKLEEQQSALEIQLSNGKKVSDEMRQQILQHQTDYANAQAALAERERFLVSENERIIAEQQSKQEQEQELKKRTEQLALRERTVLEMKELLDSREQDLHQQQLGNESFESKPPAIAGKKQRIAFKEEETEPDANEPNNGHKSEEGEETQRWHSVVHQLANPTSSQQRLALAQQLNVREETMAENGGDEDDNDSTISLASSVASSVASSDTP